MVLACNCARCMEEGGGRGRGSPERSHVCLAFGPPHPLLEQEETPATASFRDNDKE